MGKRIFPFIFPLIRSTNERKWKKNDINNMIAVVTSYADASREEASDYV